MSRISVVVPLFDAERYIGEAIASLALQEVPPDEIVIVNDASRDGSEDAARDALALHAAELRATRVVVLRRSENGGPGRARNDGIAQVTGDLLLCMDADDRLAPRALRVLREGMERHDLALAVIGYASDPSGERFPDEDLREWDLRALEPALVELGDPLRTVAHPSFVMGRASNVVVRRSALGELRYCEDARLNEGVDLWYRVVKAACAEGARVGLFTEPLIRFRIRALSLSHAPVADWRALEPPPTVRRYRASDDPRDRRMARTIAERWLAHARAILHADDLRAFEREHATIFEDLDISPKVRA
ncbi:MAG: glycosyltransferase family 2 protein [bacterium]|nr:glycosyltransferase family 2 protein [bacterium]